MIQVKFCRDKKNGRNKGFMGQSFGVFQAKRIKKTFVRENLFRAVNSLEQLVHMGRCGLRSNSTGLQEIHEDV